MTVATDVSGAGKPARAADLDLFKTMLVWGMITAHCIQLLAFRPKPAAMAISEVINLITFSGFMFAFGWGLGLSRGAPKSWWARLYPVLLLGLGTILILAEIASAQVLLSQIGNIVILAGSVAFAWQIARSGRADIPN